MTELEALVARARSPGTFVARSRFTLSQDRAVEKLREFTLRDPHQYVLELVQAAVFAGAESVAVDVDGRGLLFAFVGGIPLKRDDVSRIFDFLFADRTSPGMRHLAQLAVGLNAVLQRSPRSVRIESGDGTEAGTLRMDMDGSGRGVMGQVEAPIRGTYLRVRFRGGLLRRRVVLPPEQAIIEERCLYTPIPILLNGGAPFGHFADRGLTLFSVRDQLVFDHGDRRGVLGVPIGTDSHRFRVVVGGVWVTTLELPELGSVANNDWEAQSFREPFIGVLCDDGLNKTADQSDVVRDARFGALLGVLRPIADALAASVSRRGVPLGGARQEAEGVPLLGARGRVSSEALAALPADEPLFRVDPSLTAWLSGPADPARFPFRVLVLDAEGFAAMEAALPEHTLHTLESPEQIDFVRQVLEAERPFAEVTASVTLATPVPMDGALSVRLHRDGLAPGWGPPGEGAPALVIHEGRSEWVGTLGLSLPGVSARFEVDSLARVAGDAVASALTDAVALHVAALVTDRAASEPAERALGLAILSAATRPRRGADGAVYAALNERWGGLARLRDAPLLAGPEGPVSLSAWLARGLGSPPGLDGWMATAAAPTARERLGNLADPAHPGWILREPVSLPGLVGWLGLAEPFDPGTAVMVEVAGAEKPLALALPCRGALRLTGRSAPTSAQRARVEVAVARLHQRLDEPHVEPGLAERYRRRFERYQPRVPARLPSPLAELARRLEGALLDAPGTRILRLELTSGDGAAVSVHTQRSEGSLVRLTFNTAHAAVRRAMVPGEDQELVLLEALRCVCVWLDSQGHPVDFLEAQQTLAAQSLA